MRDHPTPQLNQDRVRQSFCRGLASYHQHAQAQTAIAARLVELLSQSGAPSQFDQVLEFGCGTGHLTRCCLDQFAIQQLTLNDLVPETAPHLTALMAGRPTTTRFSFGPIETLSLPGDLDLILSASTVQWVQDIPALMTRLTASLRPGGWLALSGFGTAQFHQLRSLGSGAAAPSYIDAAGWRALMPVDLEVVQVEQKPLLAEFDTALALLRHLRKTGVNGQAEQRWSRRRLAEFETAYRQQFGQAGKLVLTYDPVWLIARKRG